MEREFKQVFEIWGREFELKIVYDCFDDEEITEKQIEAYQFFVKKQKDIFEKAYIGIERYCIENYKEEIGEKIDNIFKYVRPTNIYIVREESVRRIGFLCNFRYDIDNGIAVLIENEEIKEVSNQDIIL